MTTAFANLIDAQNKAIELFNSIQKKELIVPGKTEKQLNTEIYDLAFKLFGIKKYWHKRIVRSGKNTLCPYKENPPDLVLQNNDILFFDFGPVFENWEADIGKTFVLGNDTFKQKLKMDVEKAWYEGREFYLKNKFDITGSDFYNYTKNLALKYGWEYGNHHCGHLIGNFPHEEIIGEEIINYIHPENNLKMYERDKNGNERFWIYEIHFVNFDREIGGFFEQLLY
jgi:Xaa-Pro aminopeptidase